MELKKPFLEKCIDFALENQGWVLGSFVVAIGLGVSALPLIPIDAVPDITNVQVVVSSKTGALDPEKIEQLVTRPIEISMGGLPRLEEMRSISKFGLSQVTLVFEEGTDLYWARQQVSERLQTVNSTLPSRVSPELAPVTTGLGEVLMYSVEAMPGTPLANLNEEDRLTELRSIQDFVIRPILKRVAGVADIDSNGGYQKQIHVNFFPKLLEEAGLTTEQLVSRLQTVGENFGGGYVQQKGKQLIVRTVPGIADLEALKLLPLGVNYRGKPIRLQEVASVKAEHALRLGAATRGGTETVLGTVLMRVGGNSRQVSDQATQALGDLTHRLNQLGAKTDILYSRSFLVNATLKTVVKNLLEGAALVVLVLFILLGNARAAVSVALAIPISMLIAARGMHALGISGNLMSLGAIDFGLLVDGSVVLIENVLAHRGRKSARDSAKEVIQPVVFGILIIMVVYVPILTLEGTEGKMFKPMAVTVLLALLASLFAAVFLMPILAERLLKTKSLSESKNQLKKHEETKLFLKIRHFYFKALKDTLRNPKRYLIASGSLMVLAVILFIGMGADFIPKLNEGDVILGVARKPDTGIDQSVKEQRELEALLRKNPNVKEVFSRLGTPESATDPMGVHLADTFVILEKESGKSVEKFANDLPALLGKLSLLSPGTDFSTTQPIEMRFNELLEGSRADVSLKITGTDLDLLYESIGKAKSLLEKIQGVSTIQFEALTALQKSPTLDVTPKYSELARFGVTLSELNTVFELSMGGREVGSYFESERRFPIVVHLDESLREEADTIGDIPVGLPQGGTLPLSKLAALSHEEKVTTIAHHFGLRYAALSINLAGRDVASFVKEAQQLVKAGLKLPEGMTVTWGGQFKNLERATRKLLWIVPLTLLGVFLLLLRSFGSLPQAVLVFSSVPFAAVGGVVLLFLRGIPFSISAGVGFIALIGIALLNSLVLMTVLNSGRKKHQNPLSNIIRSSVSRLRPVVMTALVASLGFLPMALNTGMGAEVQRPLATVVIGGLLTSTVLTLLLLPFFFRYIEKR